MWARLDRLRIHSDTQKAIQHGELRVAQSPAPHSSPSPSPTVLRCWANIDFLSLGWLVELRAKRWLLSPSPGGRAGCQPVSPEQQPSQMGQESRACLRIRCLSFGLCFLPTPTHVHLPSLLPSPCGFILMIRWPCCCHLACLG